MGFAEDPVYDLGRCPLLDEHRCGLLIVLRPIVEMSTFLSGCLFCAGSFPRCPWG